MGTLDSGEFVDYYAVLGIRPSADIPEIRKAYIHKAKLHHPDAGGTDETMQRLNTAYKTLISPNKKAAYDMLHNFHTGSTQQTDYRYSGGREVSGVTDMEDEEIDAFLDSLLAEYRNGPPKNEGSVKSWIKKRFQQ